MTKFYKDDENFEWVEGSDGKLVQVIKDGGRARVSFFDAQAARMPLTDAERYVLEDARWPKKLAQIALVFVTTSAMLAKNSVRLCAMPIWPATRNRPKHGAAESVLLA